MADARDTVASPADPTVSPHLKIERAPMRLAIVLVALYAVWYAAQILQHTALPYFDQTNYVMKVYDIVDRLTQAPSKLVALDPATYLGSEPVARSPLPAAVPALLWGRHATPQQTAMWFLTIRVTALVAGLYLLARAVGTARWVPGATLAILGSLMFLRLNQSHLLLDVPFACMALLAFACLVRDLQVLTVGSAVAACAAMLGLVLTKPQGALFLVPLWLVMVAVYGYEYTVLRRDPQGRAIVRRRAIVFGAFVAVLVYLAFSRYGRGTVAQWIVGNMGYWHSTLPAALEWEYFTGVLPPWIAAGGLAGLIAGRRAATPKCALVLGVSLPLLGGWLLFNYVVSYTRDPRVLWAAMPIVVCVAFIVMARHKAVLWVATIAAGGVCLMNVLLAAGVMPPAPHPLHVPGPTVAQQRPVGEIGLIGFVQHVRPILDAEPSPVLTLTNDEFVDYQALNLAARYTGGDAWPRARFVTFGWSLSDFDVARSLQHRWFVTKRVRPVTDAAGSAWRPQRTVHALLTDPASPVRGAFTLVAQTPVRQPTFGEWPAYGQAANPVLEDAMLLYRRERELTREELDAARNFVRD